VDIVLDDGPARAVSSQRFAALTIELKGNGSMKTCGLEPVVKTTGTGI
jgi:hypothetical protein